MKSKKRTKKITCPKCGSDNIERVIVENYDYEGLGIPLVLSRSVIRTQCSNHNCRASFHAIPKLGELAAAVALTIACEPIKLSGKIIKLLRKAMQLKAKELAEKWGTTPETVSRLESGAAVISDAMDIKLRLLVVAELESKAPGISVDAGAIAKIATAKRVRNNVRPEWFEQNRANASDDLTWNKNIVRNSYTEDCNPHC